MAGELQTEYESRLKAKESTATEAPRKVQELDERIQRLKARLKNGDRDMTPDELQQRLRRQNRSAWKSFTPRSLRRQRPMRRACLARCLMRRSVMSAL
jgi:predicted RNase H-like nuclease (RuvC/YqgF family)